jgi:spermidine synthase
MNVSPARRSLPSPGLQPLWAITIVFLSNACILVLELVAGRMMAPIVGVSLYTWTSIIGVVLAGIMLGNYLGGKIADRWASRGVLALLFILAAAGSTSILGTIQLVGPLRELDLPVFGGVLIIFAVVFLAPSTLLGTISPVVVKLTLADLQQTGEVVGKIYAAGAAGSIAGTFATGFFLISAFGTRLIVWGVAGGLLLIGGLVVARVRGRLRYGALLLILLFSVLSGVAWRGGWLTSRCLRETNYFCIKVRADEDEPAVRVLTLDRLVHSYVDLEDPTHLRYGYEQVYAQVLETAFPEAKTVSALFIGGGGYTFPRFLEVVYPGSLIDVIEIDPGVTDVAYDELGLPRDTTINTVNQDARHFIARLPASRRYDLVLGDAFNDFSVPYHLTTLEFNQRVEAHLTGHGIYMVNIIDGRQGGFLRAYVRTLLAAFPYVYVSPVGAQLASVDRQTFVLVATKTPLGLPTGPNPRGGTFLTPADLSDYLEQAPPLMLTDDYAPVDNLLAPVFADSGL